jgi:hypothetical protein
MKMKSLLAAIAFIVAIGSAIASEKLLAQTAWTHISDVPDQSLPCEQRQSCTGDNEECFVQAIVDGEVELVPAYDGSPSPTTCGIRLTMD